jgi:hypothetical protein
VNGNGTEWKQLSNRAEADRHNHHKFLDGHVLFTGIFHMYAATYKEMRDSFQWSSKESGEQVASQAEKNKLRKRDRNYEDECCTKIQKRPSTTYQNPRPVVMNNFFAPLRDLRMENAEPSRE